jgi:hypothetical protein
VVKQSAHDPKFEGLNPAVIGASRETIVKKGLPGQGSSSRVVIESTHDPKFKGSNPAVAGTRRETMGKKGLPG